MKNYYILFLTLFLSFSLSGQTPDEFYFNIISPSNIYHIYEPGEFSVIDPADGWGWDGMLPNDLIAEVEYAPDAPGDVHMLCEPYAIDYTGKFVLIERGLCEFSQKALNAQTMGAIGVIIRNFEETSVVMAMGTAGDQVTIPVIMIPNSFGVGMVNELNLGNTVVIGFSSTPVPVVTVEGNVRLDENFNCENDSNEPTLKNWLVKLEGDGYSRFTKTDENGDYKIYTSTDDYEIGLVAPNSIYQNCPNISFSAPTNNEITIDLQSQTNAECSLMSVDIETPFLRRCFDTNSFLVEYCNYGTITGEDAYVEVQLDPLLEVLGATIPFTTSGNNIFQFDLGDVAPSECGSFKINIKVSCDAINGQTLCAIANIYPNENCELGNSYTGAYSFVTGTCTGDEVNFFIENIGSENMVAPLSYQILKDGNLFEEGTYQLDANTQTTLSYPSDGSTYRIEAEQLEAIESISSPSYTVEACAVGNNFTTGFFNMFPPADYGESYDEECELVIGSFDPNDKTPTPLGYGDDHLIEKNVDIKYLIRFQNTGTDTAFTVVVKDQISEHFDINSLNVGAISHDYELRILEGNILEFRFDNILLTDSTTNEPGSHGFINYTLKQKNDLPLGTVITNSAAIYFDYNDPIITNETVHTIGENFLTTNIENIAGGNNIDLDIYPNPMTDRTIFHLKDIEFQTGQIQLFDLLGRPLRLEYFNTEKFEIKRKGLPVGNYFYKIDLDHQFAASGIIQVGN